MLDVDNFENILHLEEFDWKEDQSGDFALCLMVLWKEMLKGLLIIYGLLGVIISIEYTTFKALDREP